MSVVGPALEAMGAQESEFKGMYSYVVPKQKLIDALRTAREAGCELLSDVMGIDWLSFPDHEGKRFTVVYNLYSVEASTRVCIRVDLDEGDSLPTCTGIWESANFMEREVYDMFGVEFDGHPNLRKLLTPEDLEGHPHRKDFPIGETPTLFRDGRFLDPASFRASIIGKDSGLTGWKGGARKGVRSEQSGRGEQGTELVSHETTGQQGGTE